MLTPEQIYGSRVRSGMDAFRPMKEHWQAKDDDAAYRFARNVEAKVREQDEALIRQLVEALTECKDSTQERIDSLTASGMDKHKPLAFNSYVQDLERAGKAITAARARLEGKP